MLKRLIGVITVLDGWAVQSFGYQRYLPLGRPEVLAENYDRWLLDEILIFSINRSIRGLGPDLEMIERIAKKNLMTPLTYGGGIRSVQDARAVIQAGADRICMEAAFEDVSSDEVRAIGDAVGVQALLRVLPLERANNGTVSRYDYRAGRTKPIDIGAITANREIYSELIVVDRRGEGGLGTFDPGLLDPLANTGLQLVAFGGITSQTQVRSLLSRPEVSAVATGNSLNYRELANQSLHAPGAISDTRHTSYGNTTKGVRQW